mgnify:CR=1 FL=1
MGGFRFFKSSVRSEINDEGMEKVLNEQSEDAERISLVLYYRTDMMFCGTMDEESEKGNYLRSRPFKKNDKTDEELEYEFTVKGSV